MQGIEVTKTKDINGFIDKDTENIIIKNYYKFKNNNK